MGVLAGQKALADDLNAALAACLGGQLRGSSTAAINTTETVWATTGASALSLGASSTYEVSFLAIFNVTDASGQFDFKLRDTDVAGAVRFEAIPAIFGAGLPLVVAGSFLWTTTTATTKTWVATVDRIGGAGNVVIQGGSFVKATYDAPSGRIATI